MSTTLYEKTIKELEEREEDIRPSDVVLFSEPLRSALNFVIRLGRFSLTEFEEQLGFTRDQTAKIADILIKRKLLEISQFSNEEETLYESRHSAMTRPLSRPPPSIWKKID